MILCVCRGSSAASSHSVHRAPKYRLAVSCATNRNKRRQAARMGAACTAKHNRTPLISGGPPAQNAGLRVRRWVLCRPQNTARCSCHACPNLATQPVLPCNLRLPSLCLAGARPRGGSASDPSCDGRRRPLLQGSTLTLACAQRRRPAKRMSRIVKAVRVKMGGQLL